MSVPDLEVPPKDSRVALRTPLSARLGALLAASGSASVVISFVYDWGFLFALGIPFSEAPTAISDHVRGWLIWLPIFVAPALIILSHELLASRIEQGLTEEQIIESSPNPERTRRRRNRPWKFIDGMAVVLLLLWLVFGELFAYARFFSFPVVWMVFVWWVFRNPRLNARWSTSVQAAVAWVPAAFFVVFFVGVNNANSEMSEAVPSHRIAWNSGDEDQVGEEVRLLRSFQDWILVRDSDQNMAWIRSNGVARMERLEASVPFQGLVCLVSSDWCLSNIRQQPVESPATSEAPPPNTRFISDIAVITMLVPETNLVHQAQLHRIAVVGSPDSKQLALLGENHARGFFADHDAGGIRVAGHKRRHDRTVGDA